MKNVYLIGYNVCAMAGWSYLLYLIFDSIKNSSQNTIISNGGGWWLKHSTLETRTNIFWTAFFVQSTAILEVLHAALGLVRSQVFTTFLQVLSRIVVIGAVGIPFNELISQSNIFAVMLIAWAISDIVRYLYYVKSSISLDSSSSSSTSILTWLRYSLFYVLYPVGITGELMVIYSVHSLLDSPVSYLTLMAMLVYVPGAPIMYLHMMKQRKKYLSSVSVGKKQQ